MAGLESLTAVSPWKGDVWSWESEIKFQWRS
jgi:hypothetical protein